MSYNIDIKEFSSAGRSEEQCRTPSKPAPLKSVAALNDFLDPVYPPPPAAVYGLPRGKNKGAGFTRPLPLSPKLRRAMRFRTMATALARTLAVSAEQVEDRR